MNKLFQIVIFPALLSISFVALADDKGGDRVNNSSVDTPMEKVPEDEVPCAETDKECLKKKEAAAKKKADDAKAAAKAAATEAKTAPTAVKKKLLKK